MLIIPSSMMCNKLECAQKEIHVLLRHRIMLYIKPDHTLLLSICNKFELMCNTRQVWWIYFWDIPLYFISSLISWHTVSVPFSLTTLFVHFWFSLNLDVQRQPMAKSMRREQIPILSGCISISDRTTAAAATGPGGPHRFCSGITHPPHSVQ